MKSINDNSYYRKKSESNGSANLTTQPSPPINLPIVCENPKDIKSNTSKDANMYIKVDNELTLVETSSKRQNTLSLSTPQTRNTNTSTLDYDASCIYTIIANNLTRNLKEFVDPNWELDIKCTISDKKIPRSIKK